MKRIILPLLCAVTIFVFTATTVYAANAGGFVALGAGGAPDYEGSNDYDPIPVLLSRYTWNSGRYVQFGGTPESGRAVRISANLMHESRSKTWQLGPLFQYRNGRDDVEDHQVDKMQDIDDAYELGFFVAEERGPMYLGLTFAADVSNSYEGFLVGLEGSYKKAINSRFDLAFGANASYASSDYMETYFEVTPSDAAKSGLPAYQADDSFKDLGLSVTARYKAGRNWGVMGFVKFNYLVGDADDSPVVDDEGEKSQSIGGIALTYTY